MQELASQSLELVNRELASTLETARGEIEDYVDGSSDAEALVRAASMLHLAAGALKIVEIHGAALLSEEMELTCRAIHESSVDDVDTAVEALTRAMVQLPVYLERLMSGGSDVALVLLPLLNDLRTCRGQPQLTEGTLLLLNTGPFERLRGSASSGDARREFGREASVLAQKLRPRFQSALLRWIRGDTDPGTLVELINACDEIEEKAQSEPVRQLWAVAGGVLIALQNNYLEPTVQIKRLLGQVDRQLKRLIDSGEEAFVESPPVDLLNSLLYYVARAPGDSERLVELRQRFGVEAAIPDAAVIEQAREDMAGPSVRLMRTVADAIREDLSQVKDVLDIFVRTGMDDVSSLAAQLEMLKKIGDTLGVLGLESARDKLQSQAEKLTAVVEAGSVDDPASLEGVATALLDIEDLLDSELTSASSAEAQPADKQEDSDSTQFRHVTQAVMRECIINLARIKESVVKVIEDPSALRALDQIEPQLRGIVAGLLMLNRNRAVNVIERIGRNITTRLTPGAEKPKTSVVERLADAIVSIEYYMETISLGRTDPFYMLDNANRCLDHVEATAGPAADAQAEQASAAEEVPGDETIAEKVDIQGEKTGSISVMEVDPERSQPELVEIFIEEAKEELANIRTNLPRWIEQPQDSDALIAVRRSWHTLKGSGRVVGAQLIGEFAWSVENLLNRVINQTLASSPDIVALIEEAVATLPSLIEQLEIGITPSQDIDSLIYKARALAEGKSADELPADAEAEAEDEAADAMDPVLRGIFVKEIREHLGTIRRFIEDARASNPPYAVSEELHRACHTLFGSARMASCEAAIVLARPLENRVREAFESQTGFAGSAVAVLTRFCGAMDELSKVLEAEEVPAVNQTLADEVQALEFAQAADASDDTRGMAALDLSAFNTEAEADIESGADSEPVVDEPEPEPEPEPELIEESADYDPEIAEIFCEEATELLEEAETQFQALKQSGGAEEPVAELKRLLHTLKGGARLAGIVSMGDLSHALETMLPRLASTGSDSSGMDLAQQALDRLHELRDAVDSGTAVAPATALVAQLEAFGTGAEVPEAPEVPEAVAEPEVTDETGLQEIAAAPDDAEAEAEAEASTASAQEEAEPEPEPADEPTAATPEEPFEETARPEEVVAAPPPAMDQTVSATVMSTRPDRAETARVDADLLDDMLNGAGEISIFQSRLNQQVRSIEFHLGELGQTVTRLREQLRSLEAETEAQIIHGHHGDTLVVDDHFDPLELDRYSTIQQLSRALAETSNDVASINELLQGLTSEADTLLTQQSRVTTHLQDGLMQTRMVSFDRHSTRLARIVRQAASDYGKAAELSITGAESQLDRQILDAVVPALEHLLRNAVVHGLENAAGRIAAGKPATGTISLKVRRDGAEVLIEVADDGAGLNLHAIRRKAEEKGLVSANDEIGRNEIIELILMPGFSTADELTQTAGRGVGMDVVDNEVKRLGGSLRIESEDGRGTRFVIRLPYTLAITHALVVNVGDETFALPLPTVEGIARVRREQILEALTDDEPRLKHGDNSYRVLHLGSLVGAAPSALPEDESAVSLVLVRAGDNSAALLADSLEGSREIIVKTLGPHIASVPGVSGATILGDGRVVMILDAGTLVRSQGSDPAVPRSPEPASKASQALTALVVDDSITMRRVTQRLLERRGARVLTARDGLDAIEVLREHDADIILLDVEMPRMDGYQFATHVRNDAKLKDTPIIMVTSRSGKKHRARAIEIGVNDYFSKPYQEAELVKAIEALTGRSI